MDFATSVFLTRYLPGHVRESVELERVAPLAIALFIVVLRDHFQSLLERLQAPLFLRDVTI